MTEPANKTVLITGACGGFGQHMVRQFCAAGARVILTDINDEVLQGIANEAGGNLVGSVVADLGTQEGCSAVSAACASLGVVPDILVNNAGVAVAGRPDHVPQERWESLLQVNLLAPIRLCELFLPLMIERGSGHIVNISSIAGWVGAKGMSFYSASKFGLRGFGESLAADLKDTGVLVTNVYPCFSQTPILESPQYGYERKRGVPPYLVSDPADVVARMIEGVRRKRVHVFPDKHARRIYYLSRFVPWLRPLVERRFEAESINVGSP